MGRAGDAATVAVEAVCGERLEAYPRFQGIETRVGESLTLFGAPAAYAQALTSRNARRKRLARVAEPR